MITLDVILGFALHDRRVMDQLAEALRSDLVVANPLQRQIMEFAGDFAAERRKLPGPGDWQLWLDGLPDGARDGVRETLGRLLAPRNYQDYDPEFFGERVLGELRTAAARTALARLNSLSPGDLKPESLRTLAERVESVQTGTLSGMARLRDMDIWLPSVGTEVLMPTGIRSLDKTLGGWGEELWIVFADAKMGKALDVNTPVATPGGWSRMGDLRVGDQVFSYTGKACNVIATTGVLRNRPCFAVHFEDGETIVADAQHSWAVRERPLKQRLPDRDCVLTTEQLHQGMKVWPHQGKRNRYTVPLTVPLNLPEADLLIQPYTLGAWLGDGSSYGAAITSADPEIIAEIEADGETVRKLGALRYAIGAGDRGGVYGKLDYWKAQRIRERLHAGEKGVTLAKEYGVAKGTISSIKTGRSWTGSPSFQERLRVLDLLHNKHIPDVYMRASYEQRLALLQGLMDTDGTIGTQGRCEFSTTTKALRDGVTALCRSLGLRVTTREHRAKLQGKDCGPAWRVGFTAYEGVLPVFRLPRKLARMKGPTKRRMARAIVAIEPVSSRPVCCIQVDAPSHLYLAGESLTPTHNSMLLQNFASAAARRGKNVLMVTLELRIRPLIHRHYRRIAEAKTGEFVSEPDRVRARLDHWFRFAQGSVMILEYPAYALDPHTLLRTVERVDRLHGVDLLVVDYLDLMVLPPGERSRGGYEDLGRITHMLRACCELEMPTLTASQAVRRPESSRSLTMRDMGDSYGKVRGADGLLSLVQTPEEAEVHQGRIGIVMARESPGGREIPVYINRELALIDDLDHPNTVQLMRRLGHLPSPRGGGAVAS